MNRLVSIFVAAVLAVGATISVAQVGPGPGMVPLPISAGALAFSTWNPSDKQAQATLSNGNLTAAATASSPYSITFARAITGRTSGKYYWEVKYDSGNATVVAMVGVCNGSASLSTYPGGDANGWGWYAYDGQLYTNNAAVLSLGTYAIGDTIDVAIDLATNKMWLGKNGTWANSGNPAAGTGQVTSSLSGTIYPCVGVQSGIARAVQWTADFGATAFTNTVPSGFTAGWPR